MELYSSNENYKLYQGNMLDMLDVIEKEGIDSIVTDPPYELNFMSKGWDNAGVSFQSDTWKKCYEVLKDGGYLLAFGGSRTFHRIACAIEDAGFEIRDTIMWLYGSGFPKSMDISKQIDKRGGESTSWFGEYLKNTLKEKNMTYSDLAKHFLSKTGGITGCVHNWVEGKNMPTIEQFNKICEILDLPFKKMEEAEREVIGQKEKLESYKYKGNNVYQTNGDKEKTILDITIPSTDLAKQWQGWGTALKPSFEPIIVARKPFKGSLVDNVIKNGVGGINIDECRVENNGEKIAVAKGFQNTNYSSQFGNENFRFKQVNTELKEQGRFPANTILTYDETDFDEVCGGFPNTKSGELKIGHKRGSTGTAIRTAGGIITKNFGGDSGSASRYFYNAKASKKDRDEGLDEFEIKGAEELLNREENSDGASWNDKYSSGNAFAGAGCPKKNTHPTVKPTSLMQYLVRLVVPNGGTILDPFNGSGSTGKAVMYENKERNKNYKYIGIELTEEYLPIAKARIEYVYNLAEEEEEDKQKQMTIFDEV